MILYLSGPITIDPNHKVKFAAAARILRRRGYQVANPVTFGKLDPPTWEAYLKRDIAYICENADGIALLPGWEQSRGARLEVSIAWALSIPIKPLEEWL